MFYLYSDESCDDKQEKRNGRNVILNKCCGDGGGIICNARQYDGGKGGGDKPLNHFQHDVFYHTDAAFNQKCRRLEYHGQS